MSQQIPMGGWLWCLIIRKFGLPNPLLPLWTFWILEFRRKQIAILFLSESFSLLHYFLHKKENTHPTFLLFDLKNFKKHLTVFLNNFHQWKMNKSSLIQKEYFKKFLMRCFSEIPTRCNHGNSKNTYLNKIIKNGKKKYSFLA